MGPESGPLEPRAWTPPRLKISDPSKSTSLFRTLNTRIITTTRAFPVS